MSVEALIRTQIHDAAEEYRKKEREELHAFLDRRAAKDKDGSEFLMLLEQSKTKFGPHAITMAEEFFQKQVKAYEARTNPAAVKEE